MLHEGIPCDGAAAARPSCVSDQAAKPLSSAALILPSWSEWGVAGAVKPVVLLSPTIAAAIKFCKRMARATIPVRAKAGMVRNIFRFATDVPTLPIPENAPPRSTNRFIGREFEAMPHHSEVATEIWHENNFGELLL
jgi:hypothetical protein